MTRTQAKIASLRAIAGWIDQALARGFESKDLKPREANLVQFEIRELRFDLSDRAEALENAEKKRAVKTVTKKAA